MYHLFWAKSCFNFSFITGKKAVNGVLLLPRSLHTIPGFVINIIFLDILFHFLFDIVVLFLELDLRELALRMKVSSNLPLPSLISI